MNFCSSFLPRADEVFSPSFSYGITSAALSRALFRPYALLAFFYLFQIFVHPHFQRRNEEAVLVLGHMVNVGLAHDKDFDSERISFDLYLFQSHHLLSDKSCSRQSMSFTTLSSARSRQPSGYVRLAKHSSYMASSSGVRRKR